MRPYGRRWVALVGLTGTIALTLCVTAAGWADTVKTEVKLTTKEVGEKEAVLGNLVADALREAAKTDVAVIAASYFASDMDIAKGDTTTEAILKTLEYKSDNISVVKLTGAQILRALEHGLYLYPKFNSGYLQFSGMVVTINPDGEKEKHVLSVKIDGTALDTGKTYRVAMPSPLANGALAYFKIWKKTDIDKESEKELEKTTLETALTKYLKSHKTIAKGDERLVKGK